MEFVGDAGGEMIQGIGVEQESRRRDTRLLCEATKAHGQDLLL